ncbi:MAG: hypothetical protein KKB31_07420 [Nanoarchaeota archaeon]|nr:hypothetical protein [Nanoarchaeota archaeon]
MANGNNNWKNWILTVLLGVLVSLTIFGTVVIQSKADKEELKCVEQRLVLRDQELKTQLKERIDINSRWMQTLSNKMDENQKLLMEIKRNK